MAREVPWPPAHFPLYMCAIGALSLSSLAACLDANNVTPSSTSDEVSEAKASAAPAAPYTTFESGQVRPLLLSYDGTRLFALNTPNSTLVIYRVTSQGIFKQAEVPVGLEPVALAQRNQNEVWVVNHLSDSVSVVDISGTPRVTRTLLVGDEPRDIVFAGNVGRAFITTAHRGQHRTDPSIAAVPGAGDPQLTTPGVGRSDVWVFDPTRLGDGLGGTPVKILTFFSDTPRALAVTPDRQKVYVAAFKSGNQTSVLWEDLICHGFDTDTPCTVAGNQVPGGRLGPSTNFEGKQAPETSIIVKFNRESGHWEDELRRNWDPAMRFRLPDLDVFSVNANTLVQEKAYAHVGTTLFNMVVNPRTGKLYVSNTESNNHTRFEGPGIFGPSTVQGHIAESRITVVAPGGATGTAATARHLNKHIDYSVLAHEPGFDATAKQHSLSTPTEMVVTQDGRTLYVAAFGSSKVGVFDTAQLEADTFNPRTASANYIPVSGGGPAGLALDESRNRLYVLTRFDNAVKVIDLATRQEVGNDSMYNPEPPAVVAGRPMLYDAVATSGNGESSCASCHIFGDTDDLSWDLGNPDASVSQNPIFIRAALFAPFLPLPVNGTGVVTDFSPMKGPMATQTLRGMSNSGAMHWRGDRADGFFGTDASDANLSFKNFVVAFEGLLGSATSPTEADMQRFADFQLAVQLPPNPVRNLDNSLTAAQQRGHDFFFGSRRADGISPVFGPDTGFACGECHVVDSAKGRFGTDGTTAVEQNQQTMKVAHLRNAYTKVGMFGLSANAGMVSADTGHLGDQVRGFGFIHNGSLPTVFHFSSVNAFATNGDVGFPPENTDATRRDVEQMILAFETDLAPIVGQQITLNPRNGAVVGPRIDLLKARAAVPFNSKAIAGAATECDLVAMLVLFDRPKGFLYNPTTQMFVAGDGSNISLSDSALRLLARLPGKEITYTCVPPGSGPHFAQPRSAAAH
jgi:YVTN family beta-propeller protein